MEYQINSFVFKFNELWNRGYQTKLSIENNEGRASLHLELDLGLSHAHISNRNGPSRQRRRKCRTKNGANNSAENTEIGTTKPVETVAKSTEKVINTTKAPKKNVIII